MSRGDGRRRMGLSNEWLLLVNQLWQGMDEGSGFTGCCSLICLMGLVS